MGASGSDAAVQSLQRLGFSEYEARAYVALLRSSGLNGYEVAKHSGIPRANIYPVLDKLVGRGALLVIKGEGGPRYAPVEPDRLVNRIESEQNEALQNTAESLRAIKAAPQTEEILSARGYSALIDHAASAIREAHEYVLLALFPNEAQRLEREMADAEARGVLVTILCLTGCPADCGFCRGHAYRYRVTPPTQSRWFIAAVDGKALVAGQIDAADAGVLLTRQPMLVELTGAYIRQSIAMASVIEDLGPALERSLKPRTRKILQAVSPQAERSFIDYMNELMSRALVN